MNTIHEAAQSGDILRLKAELRDRASCEVRDEQGFTPLMTATVSDQSDVDVLDLMIDRGCDVNAVSTAMPVIDMPADVREIMEDLGMDTAYVDQVNANPPIHTPLSLAVEQAPLQKVQLLIDRGADVAWIDQDGYGMLLKALHRTVETTDDEQIELLDCLISAKAPLDNVTDYGESAVSICGARAKTRALKLLIKNGADSTMLNWNDLFHTIAFGAHEELATLLQPSLLENRDSCDRTPFLLAVHCGRLDMARTLLSKGCLSDAVGFREWTALDFAIDGNHPVVVEWLIEQSIGKATANALQLAVELDRPDCARLLIGAGAEVHELDEFGNDLMYEATSGEVVRLLADAGLSLGRLPSEQRPAFLGLDSTSPLDVSEAEYQRFRRPQFGDSNPAAADNVYWSEMVQTRQSAFTAREQFDDEGDDGETPVWCFLRFGQSMTELPSGEVVEIAGEHEDHYDPDFYIYNDVVVHDGKGHFKIYGYPREVFPPTDFHTATYIDGYIYIIGSLGYPADTQPGKTPVFRLDCTSWSIASVPSSGHPPGWIHRHEAQEGDDGTIRIWGGEVWNGTDSLENLCEYIFHPKSGEWRRAPMPGE